MLVVNFSMKFLIVLVLVIELFLNPSPHFVEQAKRGDPLCHLKARQSTVGTRKRGTDYAQMAIPHRLCKRV